METADARELGEPKTGERSVAPAIDREAGEFLRAIIRRADAIAERLSADGLAQDIQIVRTVRLFAQQALAVHAALRSDECAAPAAADPTPPTAKRPPVGLAS
jgi:hypothetical protein